MILTLKKLPYRSFLVFLILFSCVGSASAARCCRHHGGVIGCDGYSGRYICADRTLSRCYCERPRYYYYDDDYYRDYHDGIGIEFEFGGGHHRHHH